MSKKKYSKKFKLKVLKEHEEGIVLLFRKKYDIVKRLNAAFIAYGESA